MMKPITSDEYDAAVDKWKTWQSFPWSKLLYSLSQFNFSKHVKDDHIRILDVGGGNGFNSIYFVKQGHEVTLLDYSPRMISEARNNAEMAGVVKGITFCQADVHDIQSVLNGQQFDLIVCHLMLEFVPDCLEALKKVCSFVAHEGLISILDANRYSEVYRKIFQDNDPIKAINEIDTKEYFHPWFNRSTPLFSSEEMSRIVEKEGFKEIGNYGVRCVFDYLANEHKHENTYYNSLEQLERQLSDLFPYKLLARFYQIFLQKCAEEKV